MVFLAPPELVNVSSRDDQHMPKLKAKVNELATAEITLNLFPLSSEALLTTVNFVPGDADDSKVYWQR